MHQLRLLVPACSGVVGVERHADAGIPPDLAEPQQVIPVVAETAVFVLDLEHQDGSALGDLQGLYHLGQSADVALRRRHIPCVQASDLQVRHAQKVCRQAPEIPLGAYIGPRPQQDPHVLLSDNLQEGGDVVVRGGEIEASLRRFVEVPEDINRDGVDTHCLGHADAVTPILGGNAGRISPLII